MSYYTYHCNADYRNDGWRIVGGVDRAWKCWDNDDDDKYVECPPNKGRLAVRFPIDITSIPTGAVITSVSVYLRAAKSDSISRSITVNVMTSDDTSKFTSRSIYLTETPTTYEIGTYTKDPLGNLWDIERLNHLIAQVYVYGNEDAVVKVFKVYFLVNYRTPPTTTVTSPAGVQVTSSPTLTWKYTQEDGDIQAKAEYRIYAKDVAEKNDFSVDTVQPITSGEITGDLRSFLLPYSLDRGDYYAYVRVYSAFNAISPWARSLFSVQPQLPGAPSIVPTQDNSQSKVTLEITNQTNLMSFQQSSAENAQDLVEYDATNCTIERDEAVQYSQGDASFKLTAASGADMSMTSSYLHVAGDADYTLIGQVYSDTDSRTANVSAEFFDENYVSLGTSTVVSAATAVESWTEYKTTGTTPTGTLYAKVTVEVEDAASTEVHHVDGLALNYGADSLWSVGGHFSRNILHGNYSSHPQADEWTAPMGTTLSNIANESRTGSDSPNVMRMTAEEVPTSISYVSTGTVYTGTTSGSGFTLNKPSSIQEGDFMIAMVSSSNAGSMEIVPEGWTLVSSETVGGSPAMGQWILTRTATSSEPASWTDGDLENSSTSRRAVVVAYRGVHLTDPLISHNSKKINATSIPQITTPTITNPDSNAWRVSAFTGRDNVSGGSMTAIEGPPPNTSAISYVGRAPAWTSVSNNTSYTINKPEGVAEGDLMVAAVAVHSAAAKTGETINAPTGWTVREHRISSGNFPTVLAVMVRTAGSSEPSSWDGTMSSNLSGETRVVNCVAYRGAADASEQFLDSDTESASSNFTTHVVPSGSVYNTDARSWSVSIFAANNTYAADLDSNESRERVVGTRNNYTMDNGMTMGIFDSNGNIGTGSRNRRGYYANGYYYEYFSSGAGFIGIIKVDPNAVETGDTQTERTDGTSGSSSNYMTTAFYDSNGVIDTGDTEVTATMTLGSQSQVQGMAGWIGLLRPSNATQSGEVRATMNETTDISNVDPLVLQQAGNQVTMTASFIGSVPATPYLTLHFYRANQLLSTVTHEGNSFSTDQWLRTSATFNIPAGTTDIKGELAASTLPIGGTVDVDRIGVLFGAEDVWRPGTFEAFRSVWSVPLIEYTDEDNEVFEEWQKLPGSTSNPPIYDPLTGKVTYVDHTPIPLIGRKYRASTLAYGLTGDIFQSPYSEETEEITITPADWWLKDIHDPTQNMLLPVKAEEYPVTSINTTSVFQPLGENYPVVLSEGFKSDTIELTLIMRSSEWSQFRKLAKSGRTLYLQSDVDDAWWVRVVENIDQEMMITAHRETDPIRIISVQFIEVKPEE